MHHRSHDWGSLSRGVSIEGSLSGGSLSRAISVWEVSVQGDLCPGVSVQGVSGEVSFQGAGSLSGRSLSRGSLYREGGGLCPGGSLLGNERAVRIPLECILVTTGKCPSTFYKEISAH